MGDEENIYPKYKLNIYTFSINMDTKIVKTEKNNFFYKKNLRLLQFTYAALWAGPSSESPISFNRFKNIIR